MNEHGHGRRNNQTSMEPDDGINSGDDFGEQELANQNNAPTNTAPTTITGSSTVAPAVTTEIPRQRKKTGPKRPRLKTYLGRPYMSRPVYDVLRKFQKDAKVTDQTLSRLRELSRLRQNTCLDDGIKGRARFHNNVYTEAEDEKKIRNALSNRDNSIWNGHESDSGSIAESDSAPSNNDDDDEGFDEHGSEPKTTISTTGLKDAAILELFSKRIKTGLPRGSGSDYKSILRNQYPKEKWYNRFKSEDHVNIQDMCFQEKSPYRSVDYNHRYDWMHPKARLRVLNTDLQIQINRLRAILKQQFTFVNYYSQSCCSECVGIEAEGDSEDEEPYLTCPSCFGNMIDMKEREEIHQKIIAKAESEITKLENTKKIIAEPIMFQTRCHWCGIKLPDVKNYSNLLSHARVDIEGVGSLPCIYEFDHEQKRLCLHCAAECGALLKEKRRFQRLYELSSITLPRGCNNCGVRESVEFRPSFDLTGETCVVCSEFKRHYGLDPDPPGFLESEAEFLSAALIENTDQAGIHWDRIANNPYANPQFEYTSYGLLNRWIHSRKTKDASALSTYILLQHNHLTRRSQDWELYTCTAKNPTQAALYFARFVSLYKKRPTTYLYIRQLEDWNIPEPRGDEWEDLSYGLQTFEQLKNRIRRSVLQSSPKSSQSEPKEVDSSPATGMGEKAAPPTTEEGEKTIPPTAEIGKKTTLPTAIMGKKTVPTTAEMGEKISPPMEPTDSVKDEMADDYEFARRTIGESVKRTLAAFKQGHDGSDYDPTAKMTRFNRWKSRMKSELGPENKEMINQLHWDKAEDVRDFREYRMILKFIYSYVFEREDLFYSARRLLRKDRLRKHRPTFEGFKRLCRMSRAEVMFRKIPKLMREFGGNVQAIAGYVPLNPPEYKSRDLPAWAHENARDIVLKTVADNRLLYIYHRHLQYLEYEAKKIFSGPSLFDDEATARRNKRLVYDRAEKYKAEAEETARKIYKLSQGPGRAPRTYLDCLQLAQEIVYKDHKHFNRQNPDVRRMASGDFIHINPKEKVYIPLLYALKMLRPNTLRTLSGPRPDLSDEKDPIQRLFLETITEIDNHRISHSRPAAAVSRDVFYEDEFEGRPTFPKKTDLPSPWDTRWNPSGEYPIYLLPPEYQVHVFQSVLTPETRTASIRLVRTERYKRQGDSVQGGGPVVLPKVINKETVRGFYRESNRTKRYQPNRNDDPEPIILLRGKKKKGEHKERKERHSGYNGIEVRQLASSKDLDMFRRKKISSAGSENQGNTIQEMIQEQERLHRTPDALTELEWVEGMPYKVSFEPCLDEAPIVRMTQAVSHAIRDARHWTNLGPIVYREGVKAGGTRALGLVNCYPEVLAFSGRAAPKEATDLVWHDRREQKVVRKRGRPRSYNARKKRRTATLEEAEERSVDEEDESESEDEYDSEDSDALVEEEDESIWLTKYRDDQERIYKFAELIGRERDNYMLLRQWLERPPESDWVEDKIWGYEMVEEDVATTSQGLPKRKGPHRKSQYKGDGKCKRNRKRKDKDKGKDKGKGKAIYVSEEDQEEEIRGMSEDW
ncbi:hypothetical protein BGZ79_009788 [Entomortierella chlamydospora]|nr:hypothetical protein BGZ79_009788 [Entomortierella chlamydospora]